MYPNLSAIKLSARRYYAPSSRRSYFGRKQQKLLEKVGVSRYNYSGLKYGYLLSNQMATRAFGSTTKLWQEDNQTEINKSHALYTHKMEVEKLNYRLREHIKSNNLAQVVEVYQKMEQLGPNIIQPG